MQNKKVINKKLFHTSSYPKELMYSMIDEFGSLIRNTSYKKHECKKINLIIKRARLLGFFPFCSAHYFRVKKHVRGF